MESRRGTRVFPTSMNLDEFSSIHRESMSGLVQSVSGFLGLPWAIASIAAVLVIVFLRLAIIAWQTSSALQRTVSLLREREQRRSKMLLTEQEKVMRLEDEIKNLEQEHIFLQNANPDLEVQSKLLLEKLDAQVLCENADTSLSSDSARHKELELEASFEIEMESLRKQAEENLMSARTAEQALAAERTKSANLRLNVTDLNTQLSDLVLRVNALKDQQCFEELQKEKIAELEEKILQMEVDQAALQEEKVKLQKLCTTLQENRRALQNQSQERDWADPQLEVSAQVAGSQEPMEKMVTSCLIIKQINPQRRCAGVLRKAPQRIYVSDKSTQVESADQLERCQCEASLVAERNKVEQLQERIRAAEQDSKALEAEKFHLELQIKSVLGKLDKMSELCQQKDQALQQKAAQLDFERREKERKVKEVLKIHKQKLQAIEEQHQKSESSYKAQVASLQKKAEENRVAAAESQHALQLQREEVASLTQKLSELTAKGPRYQEPLDTICSCLSVQQIRALRRGGAVSKTTTGTISTKEVSTQVESADQLERCQCEASLVAERNKVEQLQERIRAAEQDSKALEAEKFHLELQIKSVLGKLDKMSELCQQKDQALQQKAAQLDFERREKERKVKEVLKIHKQKLQAIEEQHQKSESSYKAQIASLNKTRDKLAKPSNAAAKLQNLQQEAPQLEQRDCQHLEATVQHLERDGDALRTEISQLEQQAAAKQSELDTWRMTCQQQEQDLLESSIKMEAAEEVMQFLAIKISALENVLQKSQSYCQAELEASEQDRDAPRTRVIAQVLQLMENASVFPDLAQTTVDLKFSTSDEEQPYQSDSEVVSPPNQTEVLPPETIASTSEAGTASSSAPGSSRSSLKTPADSARPRHKKKWQRH